MDTFLLEWFEDWKRYQSAGGLTPEENQDRACLNIDSPQRKLVSIYYTL